MGLWEGPFVQFILYLEHGWEYAAVVGHLFVECISHPHHWAPFLGEVHLLMFNHGHTPF